VSNTTFDQKATMLFELYDTDKSLTLSMEESEILMQNAFAAMSVLEEKPKPSQNHVKQSLQSFFKDADLNHDEKISLLEFKTYIRTEKTILQAITSSGLSQS
jgi:Ca2+-binding EF-hand superfamily protein